ncbi:MAG: hypothetical protein FWB75_09405, partial [Oscillospiraceae bacterium]|nr:hypothetical protein [Oscillospiraceae bacterium]
MRKHILIIIMLVVLILILASCFAQVSEVNSDEIAAERTAERQRILDELPPPTILAETAYFQSIDSLAYMLSGALGGYPLIIRVEVLDEGWEELEESRSTLWRVWIRNLRVTEVFLGDVQVGEVLRLRQTIYRKTPLLPGDDVIMFVVSAGNIIVSLNAVQSMYLVPPEIDMSQVIINGDLSMNLPSGTVFESVHPQNRLVLTIEDLGKIVRGEMPAPRPEPPPPPEPTIRLSQTRWWPGAAASSTVVEVDTDLGRWYTDVFVFADYDWLFVEQSGDTLVIRVDENLSEYPRIGMVDIISGDDVRGVVVTQSNEELTSRLSFYVVGEPGNGFEELRGFGVYGAAGADNDGPSVSPLLITPAFPPVFVQPP